MEFTSEDDRSRSFGATPTNATQILSHEINGEFKRKKIMDDYAFLDEIPIDKSHTLEQITNPFVGVKDGLPELVKNSKDQYSRLGVVDPEERQILILADSKKKTLAVLDFAGATADDFDGWTTWSSRTAGRSEVAKDIEAGHGNGGKAFMVRGATTESFLDSCYLGQRTKMGFRNDVLRQLYKPGYAKEGETILNDTTEGAPLDQLSKFLKRYGLKIDKLPEPVKALLKRRQAYTAVHLESVVDWRNRRDATIRRLISELPDQIASHGQTALTIETCQVWVMADRKLITEEPVALVELEPHPDFEEIEKIEIPDTLPDPETGEGVSTGEPGEGGKYLKLATSKKHLQLSGDLKARNVIRVWNERNNVATWTLPSMGVVIPSINFIYGELRCPELTGENLAGADRSHLSDTPLVRALRKWVHDEIEALAELIHRSQLAETKPKDRKEATAALKEIRELMRRFLDPDEAGRNPDQDENGGSARGDSNGNQEKRDRTKFGELADQIELEPGRDELALATGTTIPLSYRCFETRDDGRLIPVKGVEVHLEMDDEELADLSDAGLLTAKKSGVSQIWLRTDSGINSNKIRLEVVDASGVDIVVPDDAMLQGQRQLIRTSFHTTSGPRDDLLVEASVDEPDMGLIGRLGRFTAGLQEGIATIRVKFGPDATDHMAEAVLVGPERVPPKGRGGAYGDDIPEILLCGEEAPGMDDYPPDQRTNNGGEHFPTIIEEPQFRNVVWINPTSKEAMRVRQSRGGPAGVGGIATQTFMHFVALKCFEVLKRLKVRQQISDRSITETEFIQHSALAEIECSDFIEAAWVLSDDLLKQGVDA